jgi:hypothetical protein
MNNQNRENWTFSNWQKEDPKGLEELSKNNITAFTKLFEAEYSKEAIESNKLNNQNRENWTFFNWQEEDPKGLEELSKNNFEKFKNLFDKQFNS